MDVLRFATAGSVDDGKSSLIGRLLYDSKNLFDDQLAAVARASTQRGAASLELALVTDGLRAEREQNITIDVAYRYFTTPRRKFIIADTPGHLEYTRNMVTGVSRVDLSVILVDAQKGLLPQSKRHAAVSTLMRVPQLVVAINKMDLVGYSEDRFDELARQFATLAAKLGAQSVTAIPVSALVGDNVVELSDRMPWYDGPTLLQHLEQVPAAVHATEGPFRMFVQTVIRGEAGHRGLAGRPAAGRIAVGDRVRVLPGGAEATVAEVRGSDGPVAASAAGEALSLRLSENVDVGRGALLVPPEAAPDGADRIEAVVCWMGERPLTNGASVLIAHGTRRLAATVVGIDSAIDVETLESNPARELRANDLGRVTLRLSEPIFADRYEEISETGSLLIIDPGSLVTVGAGMIDCAQIGNDVEYAGEIVELAGDRAEALAAEVARVRRDVAVLSERSLATGLNSDAPDPHEAARRLAEVAALFRDAGQSVLVVRQAASAGTFDVDGAPHAEALALVLRRLRPSS